jgi:thioredoxin:protein disulfide reductase
MACAAKRIGRPRLKACSSALLWMLLAAFAVIAPAQVFQGRQVASVVPSLPVVIEPGKENEVPLQVRIRSGYHINSNEPAEEYLIPTRLTWDAAPLTVKNITYPDAEIVTYAFSEEPLSVYSGIIVLKTSFAVPKQVPASLTEIKGRLRYQACNDKECLPPATLEVSVPVKQR